MSVGQDDRAVGTVFVAEATVPGRAVGAIIGQRGVTILRIKSLHPDVKYVGSGPCLSPRPTYMTEKDVAAPTRCLCSSARVLPARCLHFCWPPSGSSSKAPEAMRSKISSSRPGCRKRRATSLWKRACSAYGLPTRGVRCSRRWRSPTTTCGSRASTYCGPRRTCPFAASEWLSCARVTQRSFVRSLARSLVRSLAQSRIVQVLLRKSVRTCLFGFCACARACVGACVRVDHSSTGREVVRRMIQGGAPLHGELAARFMGSAHVDLLGVQVSCD
jgi:hypothetical protein